MFYWIYDFSSTELALLVSGTFVGVFWAGCLVIRPILRLIVRSTSGSNDIVGHILSCFGVFYGLLLGLIAVASYQNLSEVESNVSKEVVTLSALYLDCKSFPEPYNQNLRWLLRDYCRYVVKYAWPLQQRGIIPEEGQVRVVAFQERLTTFQPQTKAEEILHAETLRQFNTFLEARRMRINTVTTGIPAVLWYVVILGAAINLAFLWMFEMRLITQLVLGGLLAFFLGAMIFLIAAMDNPFRGEVSVTPEAFENLHRMMIEDSY